MRIETDQRKLWEAAHVRNRDHELYFADIPTPFARYRGFNVPYGARVLEIGPGTFGKDAFYFVQNKGCEVTTVDTSLVASRNIKDKSKQLNFKNQVKPIIADQHHLPFVAPGIFDVIYARSSLYVDDIELGNFLETALALLAERGYLMIEGKTPNDCDIQKSDQIGENLFIDNSGHIRRVWTEELMWEIIHRFGLSLLEFHTRYSPSPKGKGEYFNFVARKKRD